MRLANPMHSLVKMMAAAVLAAAMALPSAADGSPDLRDQGANLVKIMAAFDSAYIPALSLTSQAQTDEVVRDKAVATAAGLAKRWPQDRLRLAAAFPQDAHWREELARVEARILEGRDHAANGDFTEAHESLEKVRVELRVGRQRNRMEYFIDRLTAFHEPMEAIVLGAKGKNPAQFDAAATRKQLAEARRLWTAIQNHLPSARDYGLNPDQEEQMNQALKAESAALSSLKEALQTTDTARVLKAAVAIKPPFARLFTAFGAF